jgi:hypothetical protein
MYTIKLHDLKTSETKEYQTPFVSGLVYRKYMELSQKVDYLNEAPTVEQMDDLVGLIVEAFNDQFTINEFYAGLSSDAMREYFIYFIFVVIGVPMEKELDEETKEQFEDDATPSDDGGESR